MFRSTKFIESLYYINKKMVKIIQIYVDFISIIDSNSQPECHLKNLNRKDKLKKSINKISKYNY